MQAKAKKIKTTKYTTKYCFRCKKDVFQEMNNKNY